MRLYKIWEAKSDSSHHALKLVVGKRQTQKDHGFQFVLTLPLSGSLFPLTGVVDQGTPVPLQELWCELADTVAEENQQSSLDFYSSPLCGPTTAARGG